MVFTQNNLVWALSPYLRQHAMNPIWWQEWNSDVLDNARQLNRPLFVSVGYSTCHWCHVMAAESFQDAGVAAYLNEHFVAIKVDREQRPDIDRYLMAFIAAQGRPGGWPLNCFLTPELRPFAAMTYVTLGSGYGMPGFFEVLQKINDHYMNVGGQVDDFSMPSDESMELRESELITSLENAFDPEFGGFGEEAKFPPHSTLLFMLYSIEASGGKNLRIMLEKTLDSLLAYGLHDHLQGGFFRYCVDRQWTTPHFEKMLYDQALLLWVFSLACRILPKESYRRAVVKLLKCLEETFEENELYYSGHDADTDHDEGATYLWSTAELLKVLTPAEYNDFSAVYRVSLKGDAEGKDHLVRKSDAELESIEEKLLIERKKRQQPFVDKKIITSWNCFAGIGFIHAHRYAGVQGALEKAEGIAKELLRRHSVNQTLSHSSINGEVQKQGFLQDYAGMLLLLTYLYEETGRFEEEMHDYLRKIQFFRQKNGWVESASDDFVTVIADSFDHPLPSSVSVAEFALLRADILLGKEYGLRGFKLPFNYDFYNVVSLLSNGCFHVVETPVNVGWDKVPVNSIQKRGLSLRDCYHGLCREVVGLS